jgi:DNA-binding LytR/AlgR family response regulator
MIKYIIVDDEYIAHDIIKGYCDALPNLSLVQHCYDAIEAMDCLRNNKVDLIFLDLNMPKLKGFEFLRAVQNPPKVIVTTAYQEYALEGYELNIVDYLLKPFSFERFIKAVNKVGQKEEVQTTASVQAKENSLFLKSNKKHIQIQVEDILFIESKGNYMDVVTKADVIQVREKISDMLQVLPEGLFIQIHKSFAVAKKHIAAVEGNRVFLAEHEIPVGKTYKLNLNLLLGK